MLRGLVVTNEGLAKRAAVQALKYKQEYLNAEKISSVPAYWIMGIHYREADNSQRCCLANGDPIIGMGRRTTHVPAGLGPYKTFSESVSDGVRYERLGKTYWNELAYAAYAAQCWHGWGTKTNDSYLWRATSKEQAGMWVADHVFDRSKLDPRAGVVALWLELFKLDPNLKPVDRAPSAPLVVPPVSSIVVSTLTPDTSYIVGAAVMALLYVLRWYLKHGDKDMSAVFANPVTSLAGLFAILATVGTVGGQIVSGHPVDGQLIGQLVAGFFAGSVGLAAKDGHK
jgi:lysozyme family protein